MTIALFSAISRRFVDSESFLTNRFVWLLLDGANVRERLILINPPAILTGHRMIKDLIQVTRNLVTLIASRDISLLKRYKDIYKSYFFGQLIINLTCVEV